MLPPSSPAQLCGIQLIHCYFLEVPSDIMLFTFNAQNANAITTAKQSALQAWAKKDESLDIVSIIHNI